MGGCKGRKIALARTVYCAWSGTEMKHEPATRRESSRASQFKDLADGLPSSADQTPIYSDILEIMQLPTEPKMPIFAQAAKMNESYTSTPPTLLPIHTSKAYMFLVE
jgi:hypothetical protein